MNRTLHNYFYKKIKLHLTTRKVGTYNMAFFGPDYTREGPGIDPNAPPKTGLAYFSDNLVREFWGIWTLNLLFILACIPVITIGPAIIAMFRVLISMVRDQNVYVKDDFIKAFKDNFILGITFGIPFTLVLILGILLNTNVLLSAEAIASGQMSFTLVIVTFVWTFFTTSIFLFMIQLLAYIQLPFVPVVKNSIFLMFLGKGRTALAFFSVMMPATLLLFFIPFSVVLVPFIGFFSYPAFVVCSLLWPIIDLYIVRAESTEQIAIKERKAREEAERIAAQNPTSDNDDSDDTENPQD